MASLTDDIDGPPGTHPRHLPHTAGPFTVFGLPYGLADGRRYAGSGQDECAETP